MNDLLKLMHDAVGPINNIKQLVGIFLKDTKHKITQEEADIFVKILTSVDRANEALDTYL